MNAHANQHYLNTDRPVYELGYLLKQLSPNFSAAVAPTKEDTQIAQAASAHAQAASHAILAGLEALGSLLAVAGGNESDALDARGIMHLGYLVKHLAVEAQFMQEMGDSLHNACIQHAQRDGGEHE